MDYFGVKISNLLKSQNDLQKVMIRRDFKRDFWVKFLCHAYRSHIIGVAAICTAAVYKY